MPKKTELSYLHAGGTEPPRIGLPTLVKLFSLVLITLSALSLLFIGYIASRKADDIAVEKQILMLENVLRDRHSLLARDQLGLARWDRSVKYITLKFRPSYVVEEFVSSLWYDFGHERSFLIGPGGRLLMSAVQDEVDLTARDLKPGEDLKAIAELALTQHHAHRTTIDGGYGQKQVPPSQVHAIAAFGFAEIDGDVMLTTAMAIVPDDGEVALPDGDPVILVSARPIDAELVADINSQLEYGGLQFNRDHVRPLLLGATSALKLLALPLLAVLVCRWLDASDAVTGSSRFTISRPPSATRSARIRFTLR